MMARKEKPKKCQQRLIGFEAQNLELFRSPSKSSSTFLPADVDPIPVGWDKLRDAKRAAGQEAKHFDLVRGMPKASSIIFPAGIGFDG